VPKSIEIRCPIYGFIPLDAWEGAIIAQPALQRLRRIRQLAWTDYVYPGAMHTRFEHTLGVMHMATMLFDQLVERCRPIIVAHFGGNEAWVPRHKKLIRLAALLHDVGHGPFSHVAEELMPIKDEATGERFTHEDYLAAIIRTYFAEVIDRHKDNAYGIRAADVADLIEGAPEAGPLLFWRPLISGQMDADRMDYLLRDAHHIGVDYGHYGWQRLIHTITVTPVDDEHPPRIGVTEGGWNAAESLIVARYMMFNQVYYHKTRVVLDHHVHHALADMLQPAGLPKPDVPGPDGYLSWDDWRVLGRIADGGGGEHGRRLRERDLYREIQHGPPYPSGRDDRRLERWRKALGELLAAELPSNRSWYKVDDTDIAVVSEDGRNTVAPLSFLSPIVRKMGQMRQVRLYVRNEDRKEAERRLAKVERKR
jgi:HD superfamily phosphohydrolase